MTTNQLRSANALEKKKLDLGMFGVESTMCKQGVGVTKNEDIYVMKASIQIIRSD